MPGDAGDERDWKLALIFATPEATTDFRDVIADDYKKATDSNNQKLDGKSVTECDSLSLGVGILCAYEYREIHVKLYEIFIDELM